ncbi:aryl-sulfate sulfotransferase [Microvirga tunisiensis]|uniref:Aryl-sulfate sulfotransferase n=2 Tax=Pannonibacter tanglangensis TaxID=2750084 RepID=A0ABW9ZK39_9HYPH|nr:MULTISPECIES: ribbon-helix-helix domain-containing protein [unclassified Pannonibacter]NBN63392.1 aryl-sulfate sulfotransferase [Pannonibacter sp. XCT-34]NBN77027.1 aryl-sulfate sulfotransferase [Pannonibacter sp. XCT-53]
MPFLKRSLSLKGHRTSLALEPEFWQVLDAIAADENRSLASLIDHVDSTRAPDQPLSSAARVHALRHLRDRSS